MWRLVHGGTANTIERVALEDAAGLLSRALGQSVAIAQEGTSWTHDDILVGSPGTSVTIAGRPTWHCHRTRPGAFRLQPNSPEGQPAFVVVGTDPEGVRNGLYRLLTEIGFAFFIDGEVLPDLRNTGLSLPTTPSESEPAFGFRGTMIWDFYLGPRRYCAATWGPGEWERALLFLARTGQNFVEFYPPMEHVLSRAFPLASGLDAGIVWPSRDKHDLAQRVLARGRALGIRFAYVLTYGQFTPEVRASLPHLHWSQDFLCAHQPELAEMTRRCWGILLDAIGTDHLYVLRHRGEEGQSYSDPCRTVTKEQGMRQGISVLQALDPAAKITVWTWSERVPELFEALPDDLIAEHIRHGMGRVFDPPSVGRDQPDGAPPLPPGRQWYSAQFTVFSGSEVLAQTARSDASKLAEDARVSARDGRCLAYYEWPEWSGTSPLRSQVCASLAWDPEGFAPSQALRTYARARHGRWAETFLALFAPLATGGNACFVSTPRKRMVVPFYLSADQLGFLRDVLDRIARVRNQLPPPGVAPLLERDFLDVLTWTGLRLAHVSEVASYGCHVAGDLHATRMWIQQALASWHMLQALLTEADDLGLAKAAHAMAREGEISPRAVDSFWTYACDFYHGYPLVLSPEAIELVFAPQCERLGAALDEASAAGHTAVLETPSWFWHDFPDPAWSEGVRTLPREDSVQFEREVRRRVAEGLEAGLRKRRDGRPPSTARALGSYQIAPIGTVGSRHVIERSTDFVLRAVLPPVLLQPPRNWPVHRT